jgi:hypothetical protein
MSGFIMHVSASLRSLNTGCVPNAPLSLKRLEGLDQPPKRPGLAAWVVPVPFHLEYRLQVERTKVWPQHGVYIMQVMWFKLRE